MKAFPCCDPSRSSTRSEESRSTLLNQKLAISESLFSPDRAPNCFACSSVRQSSILAMISYGTLRNPNWAAFASHSTCLLRAWFTMKLVLVLSFSERRSNFSSTSRSILIVLVTVPRGCFGANLIPVTLSIVFDSRRTCLGANLIPATLSIVLPSLHYCSLPDT